MNQTSRRQLQLALQNCAAEPIHQLGHIQPHGVLLAISETSPHTILQASDNLQDFFAATALEAVGKPLAELLGESACRQLAPLIAESNSARDTNGLLSINTADARLTLQASLFHSDGLIVLELQREAEQYPDEQLTDLLQLLQQGLTDTAHDDDLLGYCRRITDLIRTLTGFDRVKVYQFDSNWDGEVIAESRTETAPSYLGLHFPASDIPAQARRLYALNTLRQLANIDATPAPILPAMNPLTQAPLDLSYAKLRSFSPVHIQYLHNMGVKSTLGISLLQNGKLWGIIACHHFQAKLISSPALEALNFISRMVSVKLSAISAIEQRDLVNQAIDIVGQLVKYISSDSEESLLQRLLPALQTLAKASGILMLIEGKIYRHGLTPNPAETESLIAWLGRNPSREILHLDRLGLEYPPAKNYPEIASGLMATPVKPAMLNSIIWLREAKTRHVHWAGKPNKDLVETKDGQYRLNPRASFDSWTELWEGRSEPWTPMEQSVAGMLSLVLTEGLSKKHQLDQALHQQRQADEELRIAATAFESQEGILLTDPHCNIIRANSAFVAMNGFSTEELQGKTANILKSGVHDESFYQEMWERIKINGFWDGEIWNKRKNGQIYPVHLTITAVKDQHGKLKNYVGTYIDITSSKAAAEEIERLAYYDPLTGLPNRRLLISRLKRTLNSNARSGKFGALLFIDLDNFKSLNDTLGHDTGDMLLKLVAQRLQSCVREHDTVARLGGDEFVIMLENLSDQNMEAATQAEIIVQKILLRLGKPYQLTGNNNSYTPSIGITLFFDHQTDYEDLLKQADIAMYQAKKAGRNTYRFFDPQMQASINARVALETDLRHALLAGEFRLFYQIQASSDCQVLGAEVLVRWQHPSRGLLVPAQFITLAEESNLIVEIGQWVIENTCKQLSDWQKNPLTRHISLSVNVSAKQFQTHDFVDQLQNNISRYRINPRLLKLELTESSLIGDIDLTISKMKSLNNFGIHFALDDFGTGYSSLQYLKRLPLDQLKIDQSFIRDICKNNSDQVIILTIIAMAKALDLAVIAEGVETPEQQTFLETHGCLNYQGYLFGKPVDLPEFETLLKAYLKP